MDNQVVELRVPPTLAWASGLILSLMVAIIGWHEIRLGRMEASQSVIKEDVREVKTDVKWIRHAIDRGDGPKHIN